MNLASTMAFSAALGVALGSTACGGGAGGEVQVTGLEPGFGAPAGDQPVKITGHNFRHDIGYTVYFGAKKSSNVTILDPDTLIVSTPRHEGPGAVDVVVSADDGPAFRIANGYEYREPAAAGPTKSGNLAY